ncbi:putative Calmodulin-binding domain, plant [Lupinus albus]|uniref:Putative Calmodulin-binding domain, plant n=1 Tax=Lupinus albus TaxID=3870 RepID=A0A6A4Q8G5_LUPAL|nr:putative Calmodulin-binding domain, plant [Lupinus albus]
MTEVVYEKIEAEYDDEKANPIERLLTIKKGSHKAISRYLSGPTGSCHYVCKYGTKRAIEAKPWKTIQKKVATRERKIEVPGENVTRFAMNKKSRSSSKPSPVSKSGKSNIPVDIIKEVITSEKNSTPLEEANVSVELNNSGIRQTEPEPSSISVEEVSKNQTKREIVKNKSGYGSSSRKETATEIRCKQKMTYLIGGKEKPKLRSNRLSPKHRAKKPSTSSSKTIKNLTEESLMKTNENVEEAKPEELESNENLPYKILDVIEPTNADLCEKPTQACDANKVPSPPPASLGDGSLKQTIEKSSKSGVSAASSRKGLKHGIRSNISHISSGDKGKRNMLHKTGSASRSPSVLSYISSSNITGHGSQGENMKVGYKIRPKLSTIVGAANMVVPARKLTFKRGRVIELQPQSNNIARRLKFRPVRLLGDDFQNNINGTIRRIITSKEGDNSESNAASIKAEKFVYKYQTVEGSKRRTIVRKIGGDRSKIDGSKSGPEKVALRHEIIVGEKLNRPLYNNVIEETASRLAGLRKSNVKALVGAFETVISLDSPRAEATHVEVSTPC